MKFFLKNKSKSHTAKKQNVVANIFAGVVFVFFVLNFFLPNIFFTTKHEVENISFFYNTQVSDFAESPEIFFDSIVDDMKKNPFYSPSKKIKIYFCDSHALYTFFSPLAGKSIANAFTFFNYSRIVFSKTDFSTMTVEGGAKVNNVRDIKSTLLHECTHSFFTRVHPLLNRLQLPAWKEEGIAEYISVESSYDVDERIDRLYANNYDNTHSWKYFTYRTAVLYMTHKDKMTLSEIIKDRRSLGEILNLVKATDKEIVTAWFGK